MAVGVQYQWFSHVRIGKLLLITGAIVAVLVMCQSLGFSSKSYMPGLTSPSKSSVVPMDESAMLLKNSKLSKVEVSHRVTNNIIASDPKDMDENDVGGVEGEEDGAGVIGEEGGLQKGITFQSTLDEGKRLLSKENVLQRVKSPNQGVDRNENYTHEIPQTTSGVVYKHSIIKSLKSVSPIKPLGKKESLNNTESRIPLSIIPGKVSLSTNKTLIMGSSIMKRRGAKPMSLAHMNLLFLRSSEANKFTAPRITRNNTGNSIRVLCNCNVARGFTIGKDVSLPVTYIRSGQNPQKDLGGNPSSERPILAFFAGSMHGYLRPILLQYWENKEPDMKIFGPMPRGIEGKAKYREYMKSSKYCICAKGYGVHTPRVVESIYYECVPVIISDNYVPPFFEIFDWEAFSVFVPENDIPNLRNILLSIPEEKYVAMQQRVKMVQRHFLWNKKPVKYDLFHMTLHSVWYNRVFQIVRNPESLKLSG